MRRAPVLAVMLGSWLGVAAAQEGPAGGCGEECEIATVAPGGAPLDAGVLRPHEARWRLVRLQPAEELGRFHRSVGFVHHTAGEPAILVRWHFTTPRRSGLDIYYLDRRTLLPIARYVTAPDGVWVQYQSEDRIVISLTRRTGAEPVFVDAENPDPRFNGAMLDVVLASLPLTEGYAATWPVLRTSGSTLEEALGHVEAMVEARDVVALPDGRTVGAWRVGVERAGGNPQRVWIANEPPYLLRRDVLGGDGDVVVRWELTSVSVP